jgi:hypothetical protein
MVVEISIGEVIDKISILEIKSKKITDPTKLENVKKEFDILLSTTVKTIDWDSITDLYSELIEINSKLWDIEDNIRIKEKNKEFDSEFIELARSVYYTNDERFRVKSEINKKFDSNLIEEKSYEDYE